MVRRLSGRRAECATPALGMDPNDDDAAFKTVKDVSREEFERMAATPQQPLPVTETLLFDKPEHIVPREARDLIPEDNQWGFRLNVPQHKYNRGEIYNLSISRGSLTAEERYMVNDHIDRVDINAYMKS